MHDRVEVVDEAAITLLEALDEEDDVAYGETGGVARRILDAVGTECGLRHFETFNDAGAWCRPFVEGRADYRYSSSLDAESLSDVAGRAIRAARHLAQTDAAAVDASVHRTSHAGWGDGRIAPDDAAARLESALEPARDAVDLDRAHVVLSGASEDVVTLTTTDSVVRTHRDRIAADLTVAPTEGPVVRRHLGTTAPATFWSRLDGVVRDAVADARRFERYGPAEESPTDELPVILAPRAAAQFVHHFAHYLEADAQFAGLSPYTTEDRVGPPSLTLRDEVPADSWAALAYDAEARPTTGQTLVRDGVVVNAVDDTASAVATGREPAGSLVPSLGHESAPRLHARHLSADSGSATQADLRDGAAVVVERLDDPSFEAEIETTQREGWMPASSLYARDVAEELNAVDPGHAHLPVAEGYVLHDGAPTGHVENRSLVVTPDTPRAIETLSGDRETLTGVCHKHGSSLPFSVTSPAMRLTAPLRAEEN